MLKIGMVGVGAISGIYLKNITNYFREIKLEAVCDLIHERAQNAYDTYHVPKIYDTMEELFSDPEIDIVLNLTRPYQHFAVTKAALEAGKHVYSENRWRQRLKRANSWWSLQKKRSFFWAVRRILFWVQESRPVAS